jgi:hydroxyethylthiazole kinase
MEFAMVDNKDLGTWESIAEIRRLAPVVHNITNYVVMNNTANALLALGASPVMAHAEEEMAEMVGIASALVINIGTLSPAWIRSMFRAAECANQRGLPIVLDPVGAGATSLRTGTARELLQACRPAILRGNASEILAVCGDRGAATKGVDSRHASQDALAAAQAIHDDHGCVVCVSGAVDYVVGGGQTYQVRNGHPMMPRVTGLGCTASSLCGAFAAVQKDPAKAAAQAMVAMGVAGELAAAGAEGPGSLQMRFLDALYQLDADSLARLAKVG